MGERLVVEAGGADGESDDREVAGAAAEVCDEDGGVGVQALGKEVGGGDGFVDVVDFLEAHVAQGGFVAFAREGIVGRGAGEADRAADHHTLREVDASVCAHLFEKAGQQVLKFQAAIVDQRVGEVLARGEGLEGLDEAAFAGCLHELVDRPWSCIDVRAPSGVVVSFREAQHRAEGVKRFVVVREVDGFDMPLRIDHRRDGVCRAEIEADGQGHGATPSEPTGASARGRIPQGALGPTGAG